MGQVSFTANLHKHVDCSPARVAGATVREALDAVFTDSPAPALPPRDEQWSPISASLPPIAQVAFG